MHGVPSVVSATQTYCEVIENDVTGLISRSIEEWRFNVTSLIDDPQKRRKMGDAARHEVMQKYGAAEAAQALVDTIDSKRDVPKERKKKKRLLVVNAFYPPQSIGGATRVVADMVRSWVLSEAAEGWEFAIATTDYDCPAAYQQTVDSIDGVMVFRIAAPLIDNLDWTPYDPNMKQWFARLIDVYKPDIVHFHSIQRLTASIVEACIEAGIPYVVSVHDGWWLSDYQFLFDENAVPRTPGDEWERGLKRNVSLEQSLDRKRVLRPLLEQADAVVTPSRVFQEIYQEVGFKRVRTIPNGLPKLSLKPRHPSPSGRVRIGHIGDMSPHKGFDLLEAALRQNRFENIELVGISHASDAHSETRDVWGATPVLLKGKVAQEFVGDLYAELDVLVAPSACVESFGLVTREANAAGLWVIASDRGAIGEDVRPGVDGFVIDVSSPKALVDVLTLINENPGEFLVPAPTRAISGVDHQATETLALLESILLHRGANC